MANDDELERQDESHRLDLLRRSALLDSPPEPSFDRVTRLASKLVRAHVTLVSLVDENRQFFKSSQGLPEPWNTLRGTPLSHSFANMSLQIELSWSSPTRG